MTTDKAALVKNEQEAARIREFIEDPIISGYFEKLEHQKKEAMILEPTAEARDEARLFIKALRALRSQMKIAQMHGATATAQLAKLKEQQDA